MKNLYRLAFSIAGLGSMFMVVVPPTALADEEKTAAETMSSSGGNHYRSYFNVTLEGSVDSCNSYLGRMDKIGAACRIASTVMTTDSDFCSEAQTGCSGRDNDIIYIMDPWRTTEHMDIPCHTFVALACGGDSDINHLTEVCRENLTGHMNEDPAFITPVSFLCGVAFTGAILGAEITSGRLFPEHSELTSFLGAATGLAGGVACAVIPF